MQKFFLSPLMLLLLALPGQALAEKITCHYEDGGSFTMELPDGWAHKTIAGGCAIKNKDGSQFMTVAYFKDKGLNAKAFAAQMCQTMKVTPKYIIQEDKYVSMEMPINGKTVTVSVASDGNGGLAQVVSRSPNDSDELDKIFDSVD